MDRIIPESELILNEDNSIYHLNLCNGEIAETIFLVGDPNRATLLANRFDYIECCKRKRELITYTGTIGKKRLTVVGTGMGSGNIDIVMNELDAVANIDFSNRQLNQNKRQLEFIRLGTTGGLTDSIDVGELLISDYSIGMDGLLHYYVYPYDADELALLHQVKDKFAKFPTVSNSYACKGSKTLTQKFATGFHHGITLTCVGFYAPQGRMLRAPIINENIFEAAEKITFNNLAVTNIEMETAAIYGIAKLLGHHACSINLVLANRKTKKFYTDHDNGISNMIDKAIELVCSS